MRTLLAIGHEIDLALPQLGHAGDHVAHTPHHALAKRLFGNPFFALQQANPGIMSYPFLRSFGNFSIRQLLGASTTHLKVRNSLIGKMHPTSTYAFYASAASLASSS